MAKEEKEDEKKDQTEKSDKDAVTITVDGKPKKIVRGNYDLAEFKRLVGIAENMDVDEVVKGKFEPLSESKKVHIKGDEIFVSHVKTGSSS